MNWTEFGPAARRYPAPDFRLTAPDGATVTRSQFRHAHPLVLIFVNDPGAPQALELLRNVDSRGEKFAQIGAQVYAVSPAPAPIPVQLPILADPDNATRQDYLDLFPDGERPAGAEIVIVILDRYGTPGAAGSGLSAGEPAVDEMLAWVWGLELECPE